MTPGRTFAAVMIISGVSRSISRTIEILLTGPPSAGVLKQVSKLIAARGRWWQHLPHECFEVGLKAPLTHF